MRIRLETVMSSLFGIRSRRGRAAVEPFGEDDTFLLEIAQGLIEVFHHAVVGADQELQLLDAALAQPIFGGVHHGAAISFAAAIRIDGEVIDPAAMTVMPDEHRSGDRAIIAPDQHRRVGSVAGERDVGGRIVPRPRQAAGPPKRDDIGDISVTDRRNRENWQRGSHRTLPGFMIPSGSSSALMERINSIATLSFTSGNSLRLSTPMPCSAEIDPPIRSTISKTTAFTSCQRARKSEALAPIGWLTL